MVLYTLLLVFFNVGFFFLIFILTIFVAIRENINRRRDRVKKRLLFSQWKTPEDVVSIVFFFLFVVTKDVRLLGEIADNSVDPAAIY